MNKIQIIKMRTASHEVDPQKGFTPLCPDELVVPDGHNIAEELNRQSEFAKYRTISKDVHPHNAIWLSNNNKKQFTPLSINGEPNVDTVWNAHCMSGTYGSELIPGLPKITEYNFIAYKGVEPNLHPYSGVYHDLEKKITTGLIEYYKTNNINTIIVGGLALDFCLKDTVIDLCNCGEGFRVIVNLAATRAIGDMNESICAMNACGAEIIMSSDDLEVVNVDEERVNALADLLCCKRNVILDAFQLNPHGTDSEIIQLVIAFKCTSKNIN